MTARASRKADRTLLLDLAKALNVSRGKLKQDACSDWNISARRGHISTDLSCFYAYLHLGSPRRWEYAKRTLSFVPVTQDGDNEGIFKICEMPTAEQAAAIRKVFGMRKATPLTEQQRETISRRLNLPPRNRAVSDDFIADPGMPATILHRSDEMQKNGLIPCSRPLVEALLEEVENKPLAPPR